MLWIRYFIMIPVLIPIGIYLYHYIKRVILFYRSGAGKRMAKLAAGLSAVLLSVWALNMWGVGFVVVMHLTVLALLTELIQLICKQIARKKQLSLNGWNKVYRCGLVPVLLTAVVFLFGCWNIRHVTATEYSVTTDKQLREEGYRIALISDLHFGLTLDAGELQEYADEISAKQPDLVILDGDIVDENTAYGEMCAAAEVLGSIQSTYGTFYVFGNHDKNAYTRNPAYTAAQLQEELEKNGITVLVDELYTINEELVLVGRDDPGTPQEDSRKSSSELISEADQDCCLIMLDHQPLDLAENAALGYDLQLSGHTHGGQIWPVGPVCSLAARLASVEYCNYGMKQIGDFQVIVSSGIAGWGYPIKTGAKAEYVIVDIHN